MWSKEIQNRVVYISGPHGSGKSTLVNRLKEVSPNLQLQEQLAHLESLQEMTERVIWRVALHAIEHRLNLIKASQNPSQIIVGDRCYLDDVMYWRAFERLGWITKKQMKSYVELLDQTYRLTDTPKPLRIILLAPPYDWNVARVRQRWAEGEHVKWHEDDFGYLAFVNEQFRLAAGDSNGLVLAVVETDLETRVAKIHQWVDGPVEQGLALVEAGRQTYRSLGGSD